MLFILYLHSCYRTLQTLHYKCVCSLSYVCNVYGCVYLFVCGVWYMYMVLCTSLLFVLHKLLDVTIQCVCNILCVYVHVCGWLVYMCGKASKCVFLCCVDAVWEYNMCTYVLHVCACINYIYIINSFLIRPNGRASPECAIHFPNL